MIGFAGTKDRPIPMREKEVDSLLAQVREREDSVKPKISFEVGDNTVYQMLCTRPLTEPASSQPTGARRAEVRRRVPTPAA